MSESSAKPSWPGRVAPAVVVIAVGVVFLLNNLGIEIPILDHDNWWAWLILVGALSPLSCAVERYRRIGHVDSKVLHSLLASLAVVMVALMFILQLSWAQWWPLFVIYGGLSMMTRERSGKSEGLAG
ncbi:MAG: hypothetical protein WC617_09710 [Rhodanobacter sp.]